MWRYRFELFMTPTAVMAKKVPWTRCFGRKIMCAGAKLGPTMDLGSWLRSLGLERYEAAFRENEIDEAVLPNLTAEDLKDLGLSGLAGKLLDADRCSAR